MATTETDTPLGWFEVPRPFIEPMLYALRLGNTLFDTLFYDVNVLTTELLSRGSTVVAEAGETASSCVWGMPKSLNLSALSNPEGAILVVDSGRPPYVLPPFADVGEFVSFAQGSNIKAVSVTGVGSSALGSVAFAWNISRALEEPVAAIVPGYGVADVVQQALGGWFFGVNNWVKEITQEALAHAAPRVARIGRQLMMTAPDHAEVNGAPVFQRGSGSSDVLHAILKDAPGITRVFGHSKGALVIENAMDDLPEETAKRLRVETFGCPIGEDTAARYLQFLGLIDGLGLLNSWGNWPEAPIFAHHSTNTWIPLSMAVALLSRGAMLPP